MIALPRARAIAGLSLPIAFSLFVQSSLGLVSTAVVGRLGEAALAGVGAASALVSVLMALLFGVDAGVQALVSRRKGAGEAAAAGRTLSAGLWIALLTSVVLTAIGVVLLPSALPAILHEPDAVRLGAAFLAVYAPLLVPLSVNMTFGAYWNGSSAPGRGLAVNLAQLPVHALLVWALAYGGLGLPALGVVGAGLGSTLACAFATLLHVVMATRVAPVAGLGWRWPSLRGLADVFAIGLPISLQQSLLFVSFALYLAIIGKLGVAAVAAVSVLNTVVGAWLMVTTGLGVGAGILAGTALGRGDGADASRWGWQSVGLGLAVTIPVSLALALAPRAVLGLFLAPGPALEMAVLPLQIIGLSLLVDSPERVLSFALRGTGATRGPALTAFLLQWGVQLPLAWLVGVRLGYGLSGVAWVTMGRAVAEAAVILWLWRRGGWRRPRAVRAPPDALLEGAPS